MHQPWASLLVHGIKRFEGRGWSTGYRGRLWIASTAQDPDPEDIEALEGSYRQVYGDQAKIPFPKSYPKSALLGCVDMVNCMPQEEFRKYRQTHKYTEDSMSQYLFVCKNPRVLRLARGISGQHKLWNLPPNVLKAAQTGLKIVPTQWCPAISGEIEARKKKPPLDIWPGGYTGETPSTSARKFQFTGEQVSTTNTLFVPNISACCFHIPILPPDSRFLEGHTNNTELCNTLVS